MCLAAIALGQSKRWPLVIASNRDEFFDRPALPLAQWQSQSGQSVISGRDQLAGGSWFGLTPKGRVALLTNVREPQAIAPKNGWLSRGELVMHWLEGRLSASDFMTATNSAAYAGFNLLVGDFESQSWHWISNRKTAPLTGDISAGWTSQALRPGIYGLSNAALDTPWPKTTALKNSLHQALNQSLSATATAAYEDEGMKAQLWAALANRETAATQKLPNTGLSTELELALSSAFIEQATHGAAGYGTRVSTLLSVQPASDAGSWDVAMEEKTHVLHGASALVRCNLQWQNQTIKR
jgi:uncharacterized protein with NRDE domain